MMHRIFLAAIAAMATLMLSAIEIDDCQAGQLSSRVNDCSITELHVSGHIDARDFRFIADSLRQLVTLDLGAAEIYAYAGNRLFGDLRTYAADEVPAQSLASLPALANLTLPTGTKRLGEGSLADCDGLVTLALPKSLTHIGDYALNGCGALTSVTIPQGVTHIGIAAFCGCPSLTTVAIASDSTSMAAAPLSIGFRAFANCPNLKSVNLGTLIQTIDAEAFAETGLENLNLGEQALLDSLADWSFTQSQLRTLVLPPTLRQIGEGVLLGDSNIATLTIPSTTRFIGSNAMAYMTGLKELTSHAEHAPALGDSVWYGIEQNKVLLRIAPSSLAEYQAAEQWRNFLTSVPLRGDVNGDGSVDIADVNIIINIMLGRDNASRYDGRAFVTDDNKVDIADINAIINIMMAKKIAARKAALEAAKRAAQASPSAAAAAVPAATIQNETIRQ